MFNIILFLVTLCICNSSVNSFKIVKPLEDENLFPSFSWDTIQRYQHAWKTTDYTNEELEYIAKHQLVTLEKTTYLKVKGSTEAGSILAAQQIKAKNASTKILFYHNLIVNWPVYSWCSNLTDDFFMTDKNGDIFSAKALNNVHYFNLTKKFVSDWWLSEGRKILDDAGDAFDGVFIDAIQRLLNLPVFGFSQSRADQVLAAAKPMLRELQTDLLSRKKISIFNAIRCYKPDCSVDMLTYTDGSYMENVLHFDKMGFNATYLVNELVSAAKAAQAGNIIAMTFNVDDINATADGSPDYPYLGPGSGATVNFFTAAFLTVVEKYSYLLIHQGNYNVLTNKLWLRDLPIYSKRLGPPKGPALKNGYVFTRSFQYADVVLDCEKISSKIQWY